MLYVDRLVTPESANTAPLIFSTSAAVIGLLFLCLLSTTASASTDTDGPVSVTTLEGLNAEFHCTGNGSVLVWEIDGLLSNDQIIEDRGITDDTVSISGTIQSNLTVPATLVNNGTVIRCSIGPSLFSIAVVGSSSTLTILSSIGPVLSLKLTESFSDVLWDPPVTAGVLHLLFSYNVIVMNMNTSEVIVSEITTNTHYTPPPLQSCQYYTANVTVFYKEHFGESVVTGSQSIPEEYFGLRNLIQTKIVRVNDTHCTVTFSTSIQGNELSCPDQQLKAITYPVDDDTAIMNHDEGTIASPGEMIFDVTVERGVDCVCEAKIITKNNITIDKMSINFGTFDVQSCVVSTYKASIVVNCMFVINSAEPGFVVVQNLLSGKIVWRQNYRESVNITGLEEGSYYNVSVYDNMMSTIPAYVNESLYIEYGEFNGNTSGGIYPTTTPTLLITIATDASIVGIIAGCLVGVGVVFIIITAVGCLVFLKKFYSKKTVPMEENRWIDNENIYSGAPTGKITIQNETGPLYAALQHSANAPTAPVALLSVQYSDIQQQQQQQPGLNYAELKHSKNRPKAPIPVDRVGYATCQQAQELINKDVSQNNSATTNSSGYETSSSVSSEAKTEATSLPDLSDHHQSEPTDAEGSFIQKSEDCTDNGDNTSMVYEQNTYAVEVADTRHYTGSLCLSTDSQSIPLLSSLAETVSNTASTISVYITSEDSASMKKDREWAPSQNFYKKTHKGDRNLTYHRLSQCD